MPQHAMIRCLLTLAAIVAIPPSPAQAIVVSDFVGSHKVAPGGDAFGVNLGGVVKLSMDGFTQASGSLITDRHVADRRARGGSRRRRAG